MAVFQDVQNILVKIIADWTTGNNGQPPRLLSEHHTTTFGWDTKQMLLNSTARGFQLIQPEVIGKPGQGANANLVVALTVGVPNFPAMPDGGLDSQNDVFLKIDSPQIKTIIEWIEGGCPG